MMINHKGDGILAVQSIDVEPFKKANEIESNKDREKEINRISASAVAAATNVILTPGWNDIDDATWELCKPHLKDKFDAGLLEELSIEVAGVEEGTKRVVGMTPADFKNRAGVKNGPSELEAIIKNCNSVPTLNKWLETENRDGMRRTMKDQLEKLTAPPKEEV